MRVLGRLERMDLSPTNPAVALYLRLESLSLRGLSGRLVEQLWQAGDTSLVAHVEAASDADLLALNALAAK